MTVQLCSPVTALGLFCKDKQQTCHMAPNHKHKWCMQINSTNRLIKKYVTAQTCSNEQLGDSHSLQRIAWHSHLKCKLIQSVNRMKLRCLNNSPTIGQWTLLYDDKEDDEHGKEQRSSRRNIMQECVLLGPTEGNIIGNIEMERVQRIKKVWNESSSIFSLTLGWPCPGQPLQFFLPLRK